MNQQNTGKRRPGAPGVKALIAAASVAATIAGWALLPGNDPQGAATAADTADPSIELSVPDTTGSRPEVAAPATPQATSPSVTTPRGSGRQPRPFTSTHSSR